MPIEGIETEVLDCAAHHTWERPRSHSGNKPRFCPEHAKFGQWDLPPRLKPPKRVIEEWKMSAVLEPTTQYVARWRKFWERTARQVAAINNAFSLVDELLIERYVRHCRLAELHHAYAVQEPYPMGTSGVVRQHPGWERARVAERAAHNLAVELGLVVLSAPEPVQEESDDADQSPVFDDQVGPDGNPL